MSNAQKVRINIRPDMGKGPVISRGAAERSRLLGDIIAQVARRGDVTILLPKERIQSPELAAIARWLTHHEGGKRCDVGWTLREILTSEAIVWPLMPAAHYLQLYDLLDAATGVGAKLLAARGPSQIRCMLSIEERHSEDAEEALEASMEWSERYLPTDIYRAQVQRSQRGH